MPELFIEFFNILITYASSTLLKFFPMWETRDIKAKNIFILFGLNILFLFFTLWAAKQFVQIDIHVLQWLKITASLPQLLIPFFVFRKRFFQNLFLYATSAMYAPISNGIGNYASSHWFQSLSYPLLAGNMASIAVMIFTLPPLLYFLRRLCKNPEMKQSIVWRFIWLLPLFFLSLILITGTYLTTTFPRGSGFFLIRGILYAALLLICYLLESSLRQSSENIMLRANVKLHESQLDLQQKQYEKFMENEKALKNIRHDMRHHFTVFEQLADDKEFGKIKAYSKDLADKLKPAQVIYCQNKTVNAIASYYFSLAKEKGIAIDVQLDIPSDTGSVPASDLCVIMGNILENALEACQRQSTGSYIKVRSRHRPDSGTLAMVVENSFDGNYKLLPDKSAGAYTINDIAKGSVNTKTGIFMSTKESPNKKEQEREGIGLSSIHTVCQKHGGYAQYEIEGNIFKSFVIVKTE